MQFDRLTTSLGISMDTHVIGCPRYTSSIHSFQDVVSIKTLGRNDCTLDICLVDQQTEDVRVCDLDNRIK
jgi:hypothetical protein